VDRTITGRHVDDSYVNAIDLDDGLVAVFNGENLLPLDLDVELGVGQSRLDDDVLVVRCLIEMLHPLGLVLEAPEVGILLGVVKLGEEEGLWDGVVHQHLCERLLAKGGEEVKLELGWETAEGEVGRREERDEGLAAEDRVSGRRFLPVVLVLNVLARVETLDGAGEGGEGVWEEEGLLEDGAWGNQGVVESVEVAVAGLDVGNEDVGVEVELDR